MKQLQALILSVLSLSGANKQPTKSFVRRVFRMVQEKIDARMLTTDDMADVTAWVGGALLQIGRLIDAGEMKVRRGVQVNANYVNALRTTQEALRYWAVRYFESAIPSDAHPMLKRVAWARAIAQAKLGVKPSCELEAAADERLSRVLRRENQRMLEQSIALAPSIARQTARAIGMA